MTKPAVPNFTPNAMGVGVGAEIGTGDHLIIRLRSHANVLPKDAYRIWTRAQPLPECWDVVIPSLAWVGPEAPKSPYMSYKEAVQFRDKLIHRLTQERSRINRHLLQNGACLQELHLV